MADQLRKLTSELSLLIFITTSFILFKLTFEKEVGTELVSTYYGFLIIAWGVFLAVKANAYSSQVNQVQGNSAQSLLYAGIAFAVFTVLYLVLNFMLRQSILPIPVTDAQLSQTVFQSIFGGLVYQSSVDFSQLTTVKYYLFGVLIPLIETIVIVRLFDFLAWVGDVTITNLKDPKNWSIIFGVSYLFMFFHLKIRGLNNNVDLAMTFLFAIVTLILVSITKEFEAANEFHIGTNMSALIYGR